MNHVTAPVAPTASGASRRELARFAVGLVLLVIAVLFLSRGWVLFTRPLWVDEWFTVLVASHASPVDVIADLRHGADGGAGLFHLLVWGLRAVTGELSPVALRAMSLIFMLGALCFAYAVLRRRFSRDATVVGVLAVGSHSLVVAHAFEGRFYGLWLLCCAMYAWSLGVSRRRDLSVAIAAILLTSSHWYGIISLALMSGAAVVAHGRAWRQGIRLVIPSAAGAVTLLAIAPLARGQRAAVTVNSWIADFDIGQIRGLANLFWVAAVPFIAAIVLLVALYLRQSSHVRPEHGETTRVILSEPGIVALASLGLMPLALAMVSAAGLPSMIGRYSLPAALAWAPLAALAAALLTRWSARTFAIVLIVFWLSSYAREAARQRAFDFGVRHERDLVASAVTSGLPIVFQSLHTMYPSLAATRGAGAKVSFLDLPDSTLRALFPVESRYYQINKGVTLERDFARVHAARFGFPKLVSQATLDTTTRFLFVATAVRIPTGVGDATALAREVFPHHRVVALTEDLLLLERPSASSHPARNTSR